MISGLALGWQPVGGCNQPLKTKACVRKSANTAPKRRQWVRRQSANTLAALSLAFAAPAHAGLREVTADTSACVVIRLDNSQFSGVGIHHGRVDTPQGPVLFRHHVTMNTNWHPSKPVCCDDTLTLIDWPVGMVPDRQEVVVPENGAAEIRFSCGAVGM